MSAHVWSVLLAGGVGSRFWPASRAQAPKQLLDLFGEGPMLRTTLTRAALLAPAERTIVVTSTTLAPAIATLLPEVPATHILAEPSGKNTAPAIAWAAQVALAADPEAVLMVLPADHHIADVAGFQRVAASAAELASSGRIVTIGIVPTHPETGYGYIQRGTPIPGSEASSVGVFAEKPDLATAARYLASGDFLWNAGMFFMPARLFLDELATHRPALTATLAEGPMLAVWDRLESISIDYAVLEKSSKVAVLPGNFGWSDVGSWSALFAHRAADTSNFSSPGVDLVAHDATGNVFFSTTPKTFAVVGLHDHVVADTGDAILILPKSRDQEVRRVVEALKARPSVGKDLL